MEILLIHIIFSVPDSVGCKRDLYIYIYIYINSVHTHYIYVYTLLKYNLSKLRGQQY